MTVQRRLIASHKPENAGDCGFRRVSDRRFPGVSVGPVDAESMSGMILHLPDGPARDVHREPR